LITKSEKERQRDYFYVLLRRRVEESPNENNRKVPKLRDFSQCYYIARF